MTINDRDQHWPVRIEPLGVVIQVRPSQSLLAAARRGSLRWPAPCGGVGVCTGCVVTVLEGAANLVPPGDYEAARLAARGARSAERLACHLKLAGPATVAKPGVRKR